LNGRRLEKGEQKVSTNTTIDKTQKDGAQLLGPEQITQYMTRRKEWKSVMQNSGRGHGSMRPILIDKREVDTICESKMKNAEKMPKPRQRTILAERSV
jgi:hypothetical protein